MIACEAITTNEGFIMHTIRGYRHLAHYVVTGSRRSINLSTPARLKRAAAAFAAIAWLAFEPASAVNLITFALTLLAWLASGGIYRLNVVSFVDIAPIPVQVKA